MTPLPDQAWVIGRIKKVYASVAAKPTEADIVFENGLKAQIDLAPLASQFGIQEGRRPSGGNLSYQLRVRAKMDTVELIASVGGREKPIATLGPGYNVLVGLNIQKRNNMIKLIGLIGGREAPKNITKPNGPLGIPK